MEFILGRSLPLEESLTCEFKEVRGSDPVQEIGKDVDTYAVAFLNEGGGSIYWGVRDNDRVVTGVPLNEERRDQLRQVVGQKLGAIAPPIPPGSCDLPLHPVGTALDAMPARSTYVVEMRVRVDLPGGFYLTGSGESYRKLIGGKKKLSGSEVFMSLLARTGKRTEAGVSLAHPDSASLPLIPSVAYRARLVAPILKGSRILWVDDNPSSTFYERATLSVLGVSIDVATSTSDAMYLAMQRPFDAIVSDMKRGADTEAGTELLRELVKVAVRAPVIFYVGDIDQSRPKPPGSFAITNMAAEFFHYLFDVLERRPPP